MNRKYIFLFLGVFLISIFIVIVIKNNFSKINDVNAEFINKQDSTEEDYDEDYDEEEPELKGEPYKIELIKSNNNCADIATETITNNEIFKPQTFNIYFNYNGGIETIKSKKVVYKEAYGNLPIPIKKGYTFDGWYTSSGKKIESTTKETIMNDHTLYAHYIVNKYLIKYDYNYLDDNLYKNQLDKSFWNMDNFEILTNDEIFFNENVFRFKFDKNNTSINYNERINLQKNNTYTYSVYIKTNNNKKISVGFEDDLLQINTTSSWQRVTKTFNATKDEYSKFIFKLDDIFEDDSIEIYGLTLSEGNLNVKEYEKNYNETLGDLDNPTREGYTFEGWYTDLTFKEKIESTTLVDDCDKIYYAKWVPMLYTLEINYNNEKENNSIMHTGGFNTIKKLETPISTYKITYNLNNTGAKSNKTEDIINRKFIGWKNENNEFYNDDEYIFNKNSKLIANYQDNVSVTLDSITKEDYTCYWNTKKDGSGVKYSSNSVMDVNDDIVLYANCNKNIKFERPINSGCITSEYGNRIHPITGVNKLHSGIDMAGDDKNIYPVLPGVVAKTGNNSSMGNYVVIYHEFNNQRYTSAYYHLESKNVRKNQKVDQDTIIGIMGKTGLATGIHLHLTMYKGYLYEESSTMVNPRDYINFPSKLYNYWYDKVKYVN